MKNSYYTFLLWVLLSAPTKYCDAQLIPLGTMYRNNFNLINPAAVDRLLLSYPIDHHSRQLTMNVRKQWAFSQTQGTPTTAFIQYEQAPSNSEEYVRWKNILRWGAQILYDQTDIMQNFGLYGNYSYEFKLGDGIRKIRLGISGGLIHRSYDAGNIRTRSPIPTDPILSAIVANPNQLLLDVGAGMFMHRSTGYGTRYWGLSAPNSSMWQFGNVRPGSSAYQPNRFSQFYFIWGNYISNWERGSNTKIDWEPTVFIRYLRKGSFEVGDNFQSPVSADVTLRAYLGSKEGVTSDKRYPPLWWVGAGFGTNRIFNVEVGFNLHSRYGFENNTRLSVAYNAPTTRGIATLGHSFELNMAYSWK
jgi:type IX secretion system PorP/SprF family membrane protein